MVIRGLNDVVKPLMETFSLKLLIMLLIKIVTIYSTKKIMATPTVLPSGFKFNFIFVFGRVVVVFVEVLVGVDIGAEGLYIFLL